MLHVFAHDGDSSKTTLHNHRIHRTRLYLLGKLLVEHLCCLVGIVFLNTD